VWICGTAAVRSVLSHSPQCNAPNPVYTLFNRTTLHMNHSRSYAHTQHTSDCNKTIRDKRGHYPIHGDGQKKTKEKRTNKIRGNVKSGKLHLNALAFVRVDNVCKLQPHIPTPVLHLYVCATGMYCSV
jgi:hypothetical protein